MKMNTWTIMLMVLFAGTSLVNAEGMKDSMKGNGMKGDMVAGSMMNRGMMDGKKMGRCSMMQSMMQKTVIATSDGGIIVAAGNKITKYDKDLNVVKEVEQKMDMESMQKMMDNMKNMSPTMEKMKASDKTMGEESKK